MGKNKNKNKSLAPELKEESPAVVIQQQSEVDSVPDQIIEGIETKQVRASNRYSDMLKARQQSRLSPEKIAQIKADKQAAIEGNQIVQK